MSLLRSSRAPPPDLLVMDSFSFGSDDGQDDAEQIGVMPQEKSNSFRLQIKKENIPKPKGFSTDNRIRSLPAQNRMFQDGSGKTKRKLRKKTGDRDGMDNSLIKEAFFSNSWRANNVRKENLDGSEQTDLAPADSNNSRDDEEEKGGDVLDIMDDLANDLDNMRFPRLSTVPSIADGRKEISNEKQLKKIFSSTAKAIASEQWYVLVQSIFENKGILSVQSEKYDNKNLIHLMASKSVVPKEVLKVVAKTVRGNTTCLSQTDVHGCIPLHYAASIGRDKNCVNQLLNLWPFGASQRNNDGDLPLHVATWAGLGNEDNAKSILMAYPAALITGNDVGGTPLHLASCGQSASAEIVRTLLVTHKENDYPINSVDISGNSALHIAVKTKAPVDLLESFYDVYGSEPFYKVDADDNTLFYVALTSRGIDPKVVKLVATAAPLHAKSAIPKSGGTMPAIYAAQNGMLDMIVKHLLLMDMPIVFGGKEQVELKPVVMRTHKHSWWYITTRYPKYASVVSEILARYANLHEIVALAQETDSEGFGCLFESAAQNVRTSFKNNLVFEGRYEVIAMFRAIVRDGIMKLCALDWGDRIAWEELDENEKPTKLEDEKYTTAQTKLGHDNEIEIVHTTYKKPQREVLLHCCLENESAYHDLQDEMIARKNFNFSPDMSQRLFNVHQYSAKSIGCKGNMLVLSFERPLLTLQDVFDTSRFRKRKNQGWARKSWNLLKRTAEVLQWFHQAGYVHGYVEPEVIAKFAGSNNWKLTDMRRTTKIGEYMSGDIRKGVPPESISNNVSLMPVSSTDRMKAISFDEDFKNTKKINYSVSLDEEGPQLEFVPGDCVAMPAWDIFSFGLIMGQLVLGQSMVLLPNFEQASDAHMKNLYNFNNGTLKKIHAAAVKHTGKKAADLLIKCLQPNPQDRPKSMKEILEDKYFDDIGAVYGQ